MKYYINKFSNLMMITIAGIIISAAVLLYHPANTTTTQHAPLPDAIMEDVTALILDKEGKPHLKIITPKMLHYADNDSTELETPQFVLYRNSPQPWRITSTYAKAFDGIKRIDFWDNVIVQHTADQSSPTTLIKTPTLTIHPDTQIAETQDAITLIQPSIVVKSEGMHANMDTGDIELLSAARGEYAPSAS